MLALYAKLSRLLLLLPCTLRCLLAVLLLAALALLATYGLSMTGFYYEAELALVEFFANHPFYMTAEEAQHSMLSPESTAWFCVGVACYACAIFLQEHRLGMQFGILLLSLIVLVVASCCAVFWGGILNVCPVVVCLVFSFVVALLAQGLGKLHHYLIQVA